MAGTNGKRKSAKTGELKNAEGTVLCGSLKSNGTDLCESPFVMANGRCSRHGGKSLPPGPGHPTFVHGRRSKLTENLPARLRDGFEASIRDPDIVSVRNELALLDTRVVELLDQLSGGGLDALISKLTEVAASEADGIETLIAEARALIQEVKSETRTWNEIRTTVETRRRLANSERKLLEHKQAVVEVTELRAIVAFLLHSVKEHVLSLEGGRNAVAGISLDVQKLLLPGGATEAPRA